MLPFEPEIHVIYDEEHWNLLKMKREVALRFMSRLFSFGVKSYVYGSVARGDVRKASDIDIIVLEPVLPLSSVESILAELGDPHHISHVSRAQMEAFMTSYILDPEKLIHLHLFYNFIKVGQDIPEID